MAAINPDCDGIPLSQSLRIGLVHNWPGARNSELDIILRVIPIAEKLGHVCVIIDPMGQELTEDGQRCLPHIRHDDFDVVLNLHYLNPKLLSGISYVVNWNPLTYLTHDPITKRSLPIKQFNFIADAFRSHDRVLSAGSGLVDGFVNTLRNETSVSYLPQASLSLHTTIATPPPAVTAPPAPNKAKVFYIGVNWEKLSQSKDKHVRHNGLFEYLDKSNEFAFYGLREQYGIPLWEGISSYQGELPFDGGKSIIEASRKYGITLVLSSQQHRDSELVSTRVFQACAAGTVIISDRNGFLHNYFGNHIYSFDYGDSPKETADNILAQVKHIKDNWEDAQKNALACQRIFADKFALEDEIERLCHQAIVDNASRQRWITQQAEASAVSIVFDVRAVTKDVVENGFQQFSAQNILPTSILLIISQRQASEIHRCLEGNALAPKTRITISDMPLGAVLCEQIPLLDDNIVVYSPNAVWNADHIVNLLANKGLQHDIVYSPTFVEYRNLLEAHETSEYCIKGLDGAITRLDEQCLQRFSVTSFNNATMLFSKRCITENPAVTEKLAYFGIGAVFIIAYEHWLKTGILPKLSPAVTCRWPTSKNYGDMFYNQFSAAFQPATLYRDRNMFSVFYVDINTYVAERVAAWELQQQQQNARSDVSTEYEIDTMRMSLGGISSNVDGLTERFDSGDFSRQFSLLIYIKHLLRNRPMLANGLDRIHTFMAKALKI